jgi:hypothetical protein
VPLNPSREDQFYAILHSKSLKTGHLAVPTLTFADFCSALSLYCEISQQKGARSKKTSSLHLKTASELKDWLENRTGTPEERKEALYQKVIELQNNKQVKRRGLDNVDSDLYLLLTLYCNYYFSQLVEKTTPGELRRLLIDFLVTDEKKLTGNEREVVSLVKSILNPFATKDTDKNKTHFSFQEELCYIDFNQRKLENQLSQNDAQLLLKAQDAAFHQVNIAIKDALEDGKIRHPQLNSLLTRYALYYKKQRTLFSYTQTEQNVYPPCRKTSPFMAGI